MLFNKRFLKYPNSATDSLVSIINRLEIRYAAVNSVNELEKLEAQHGIKLPEDYCHFLLTIGNGGPEDDLLPIEESFGYKLIQRHGNTFLLILTNYIDIYIGLAVSGQDYGSVWNISEQYCFPQSNQYQDIIKLAKTQSVKHDQMDEFLDQYQKKIPRLYFEEWYKLWILSKQ